MKSAFLLSAGALSLMLQGCATPPPCCDIPPYPALAPDNNPHVLEAAIDNLAIRGRAGGLRYTRTQYSDRVVIQAQFDEVAMFVNIKAILNEKIVPSDMPFNIGYCIKDHIAQSAYWDIQSRLQQPRDAVGSAIFSTTWKNVAFYCGVQNPEALKGEVNEGWRRAAEVVNSINFQRVPHRDAPILTYTPR